MPSLLIQYPEIDPVLFQIGPIAIRWYALAYITGLVLGWLGMRRLVQRNVLWGLAADAKPVATRLQIDDFLVWATLAVIIGGRLGFVLFYGLVYIPEEFIADPLKVFKVWEGGMSFHGGILAVIAAILLYCRRHKIDVFRFGDAVACVAPIGLFFGRLANFINGELWGKPSEVPWAMIFPHPEAGGVPRHPSQLYEAILEGLVIYLVLFLLARHARILQRPGLATGIFLILYGIFRSLVEILWRDSDAGAPLGLTMGTLLSLPMIAAGAWFVWRANRSSAPAAIAGMGGTARAMKDGEKPPS